MLFRLANLKDTSEIVNNNVKLANEIEDIHIIKKDAIAGTKSLINNIDRGFYLLVEEKNKIIGQILITYEWSDWRNQVIWWMHRIYINEKWRNKHIFSKLLEELEKLASKKNVYALRLYVLNKNKKAATIYEKLGMKKASFSIYQYNL